MAVKINPSTSALLILDLQNDVIGEKGKFADSGAPAHARSQNVVANVKALAAAARRAGMPVIHVWHTVEKGGRASKGNAPLFQSVADADALVRGTWGAEPVPGLEAKPGDLVIEKQRMSAYYNTVLDSKLRGLGVEKIVVTGAWTNFSVEHTSRDAADMGYEIVVVTDGTSTVNDEWQNAALNYALTNIAERVPAREIVGVLERAAKRRTKK